MTQEQINRIGSCVGIYRAMWQSMSSWCGATLEIHAPTGAEPGVDEFNTDPTKALTTYDFQWGSAENPFTHTTYICFDNDEAAQETYWAEIEEEEEDAYL
jgi:hypothetical protein